MYISKYLRTVFFFALVVSITLACDASTFAEGTPWPTPEPPPADVGTPTGSSPMSGDWGAKTDFGKITFRISPDGTILQSLYVEMNNWTCGGVTLTTGVNAFTDPPSTVEDGAFSMGVSLNNAGDHYHDISVSGEYDQSANKFIGEWREESFDTICTGTWETASR
jgi:hypothetical protein